MKFGAPLNQGHSIKVDELPAFYPTHKHSGQFWEALGRAVASFGFLENVLARAIFAFTATTRYPESEIEEEYKKWITKLENSLSDTLIPLIETYDSSVKNSGHSLPEHFIDLIDELKRVSEYRNVLCHGCWDAPDENGSSTPFYVRKRDKMKFTTAIDINILKNIQRSVSQLIVAIIETVTTLGYRFPGSRGPGSEIWSRS